MLADREKQGKRDGLRWDKSTAKCPNCGEDLDFYNDTSVGYREKLWTECDNCFAEVEMPIYWDYLCGVPEIIKPKDNPT